MRQADERTGRIRLSTCSIDIIFGSASSVRSGQIECVFILYFQKISKGKRNTKKISAVGQNKIRAITRTTEEKSLPDQRCFVRLSLLISKLPLEGHCDKMLSRRTRDDVDRIDIGALNSVFWSSLSTYYRLSPSQKDHCAITSAVCS